MSSRTFNAPRGLVMNPDHWVSKKMLFFAYAVPGGLWDAVHRVFYPCPNQTYGRSQFTGEFVMFSNASTKDTLTLTPSIEYDKNDQSAADVGKGQYTFFVRFARTSGGAGTQEPIRLVLNDDTPDFICFSNWAADGDVLIRYAMGNAEYSIVTCGTGLHDFCFPTQVCGWKDGWETWFYADGHYKGFIGDTGPHPGQTAVDQILIGNTAGTDTYEVVYIGWCRGRLKDAAVQSVTRHMRDILAPPHPRLIMPPGGAATVNNLLADDIESVSSVSIPSVGQKHTLLANDTESTSEVSIPTAGQSHVVLADDIESLSELTIPAIGQVHNILANDAESISEVSTPSLGQDHALLANDAESTSEVSIPSLTEGVIAVFADDVESLSEISIPAVGQSHILTADDVEALSEISIPNLNKQLRKQAAYY